MREMSATETDAWAKTMKTKCWTWAEIPYWTPMPSTNGEITVKLPKGFWDKNRHALSDWEDQGCRFVKPYAVLSDDETFDRFKERFKTP